jgi:hypothetical protein
MWILASAIFSFSSKLRNSSENVQLRTAIRWCHANVHSLNRRVPAAVERYASTSGSLSKVGIVLEASAHNQKQKENGTMKTIARMMTMVVFAVGLLGIHNALAQHDYDEKTVETIGGRVLSIEKTTPEKKRGYWIDLMLQTEKETIAVQLGPAWYIDKQTPRIEANDTITVTGSRVTMDGRSAIVAADITKGNELLKLREDNGIPVWPRHH